MSCFYKDGIKFECNRCGKCCTCEGYVFMFKKDIDALIDNEGFTKEELSLKYLSSFNNYTVLRSNFDNSCIFWDKKIKGCMIYKNRPTQCRTYPFWNTVLRSEEHFNEEKNFCKGIGKGKLFTKEEIDKLRDTY